MDRLEYHNQKASRQRLTARLVGLVQPERVLLGLEPALQLVGQVLEWAWADRAATMGVPTLGLYGPTDGTLTGTRGPHAEHLQGEAACVPCLKKRCRYRGEPMYWNDVAVSPPCFAVLTPERVWQATRALIAS